MHFMQKDMHWWNREEIRGPFPQTPTRDVERNDKDASKPVARHFNLPNHSIQHMTICGLSLQQGNTESRKNLEQKFIFQIDTFKPDGINERFSFN